MIDMTRRFLVGSTALVPVLAATRAGAAERARLPVFTGGAVYFRKSNPPPAEWARDYKAAADIGMNAFRHWFMWSVIEIAPGQYDWADYDRQMDLAAQNGIKTIIAIHDGNAPEWIYRKLPDARYKDAEGHQEDSGHSGSSATAGFPGLCLDNPEAREALGKFITELVKRYRNHPALLGYDLWNETAGHGGVPPRMYCYCSGSQARLRDWLKKRYGTLEALNKAWHRYSYASWDDVTPPHNYDGYGESLDFLQFRVENAYDLFDWRIALIKALDPQHLVVCHGTASTLTTHGLSTVDEWRAASRVDVYGVTWIASRQGSDAWKQYCAIDLTRAGARGKPIWHAEATGGPLWLQPQLPGRPRENGRVTRAEDVRLTHMVSCAGGATGIFYTRWRGLLDGPLWDAFGLFAMDGSKTPQAEMAGKLMRWGNAHPEVWRARPVRGEVGLLFAEESEFFNVIQQKSSDYYYQSMRGAYQAFWANNIQPDFVAPENIEEYRLLYVAYPVMLRSENAARLQRFVRGGGMLVCEGFPAYFGDGGHVGETQPNYGFDQLFGCRQAAVEFNPDLSEDMELEVRGRKIHGRYFRQDYTPTTGTAAGHYTDGGIAAVESRIGKGKTLLIGTFPGAGYYRHHDAAAKELFSGFLDLAGIPQRVKVNNPMVQARLHEGLRSYLWATNASNQPQTVTVTLDRRVAAVKDVWAGLAISTQGSTLSFTLPAKDAAVIEIG
ncbi:MAG: beta-galactosidase [Alphaproteobacteria bacterium]|nr:beta-galactosidase [Alphaproteobacteria bacterium]